MTTRQDFEDLRLLLDRDAGKDTTSAVLALSREYGRLTAGDRADIDQLLFDWLLSENETDRYDAQFLISDHTITAALPALETLAGRLEKTDGPHALYELAKVRRLMNQLRAS